MIRRVLGRFGVTSSLLSIDDVEGLERTLAGRPVRAGRIRVADQPGAQDRGHRADHGARAQPRRADAARQHAGGAGEPRRLRRRPVRAQPDQVRIGPRRRDGRRRDRPCRPHQVDAARPVRCWGRRSTRTPPSSCCGGCGRTSFAARHSAASAQRVAEFLRGIQPSSACAIPACRAIPATSVPRARWRTSAASSASISPGDPRPAAGLPRPCSSSRSRRASARPNRWSLRPPCSSRAT